jgi:hypothetical protein
MPMVTNKKTSKRARTELVKKARPGSPWKAAWPLKVYDDSESSKFKTCTLNEGEIFMIIGVLNLPGTQVPALKILIPKTGQIYLDCFRKDEIIEVCSNGNK